MLPTHKTIRVDKCVNINVILDTILFIQTNVNSFGSTVYDKTRFVFF